MAIQVLLDLNKKIKKDYVYAANGQIALDIIIHDVEANNRNYCSFDIILMDC